MSKKDYCTRPTDLEWARALLYGTPEYLLPVVRRHLEHEGFTLPANEDKDALRRLYMDLLSGHSVPRKSGGFTMGEIERGEHRGRCERCRKEFRL